MSQRHNFAGGFLLGTPIGGTCSQGVSEFVARMLTVTTSLQVQNSSVLDCLTQACRTSRFGIEAPSLLPCLPLSPFFSTPE